MEWRINRSVIVLVCESLLLAANGTIFSFSLEIDFDLNGNQYEPMKNRKSYKIAIKHCVNYHFYSIFCV